MRSEMSEEYTFKNVYISDGGKGITIYPRGSYAPIECFMYADWDVQVTFTPKARPIEVGDRVVSKVRGVPGGIVLAVHNDPSGWANACWAWVQQEDGSRPYTALIANLGHAEPSTQHG
jgi:hypothetical protein